MMTPARLYVSHRCLLCGFVAPFVRRWFGRRGIALEVVKLHPWEVAPVPAVPALVVGNVTLVGFGVLRVLRATGRI